MTDPRPEPPPGPQESGDDFASVVVIDSRDDIAAICGRVELADSYAVVVHAPKGNRQLASELGMRRLARHADESGKVVAIATGSWSVAARARQVGVPVARKPHHIRWDSAGKRVLRLGGLSLLLPRLGGYIQVFIVFIVIGAIAGLALTMAPKATISIAPPSRVEERTVRVSVSPDATDADYESFILPGESVSEQRTITLAIPTTGRAPIASASALGSVTVTNTGRAPINVPAGTVVRAGADGQSFRLDANISVTPGTPVEQAATAVSPGPAGNVAAGAIDRFDSAAFAALQVTNAAAFAGGVVEEQAVISEADVAAMNALAESLKASVSFKETLLGGERTDAVLMRTAETTLSYVDPAGRIGLPADMLLVQVEATVTALAVTSDTLNDLALTVFADEITDSELIAGSVTAEETGAVEGRDEATGAYLTELRMEARFVQGLDRDEVVSAVKGKSQEEAESILEEQYGIQEPEVELTPGWAPWLPRFDFRIDVEFLPVAPTPEPTPTPTPSDDDGNDEEPSATPTPPGA